MCSATTLDGNECLPFPNSKLNDTGCVTGIYWCARLDRKQAVHSNNFYPIHNVNSGALELRNYDQLNLDLPGLAFVPTKLK
jgi:hypothetical protein